MNVVVRGMVLGGKRHQNVRVRCADRSGIAVGKIDAAVGQTDVVNDAVNFVCRNLLPNRLLDQVAKIARFLQCAFRWERA